MASKDMGHVATAVNQLEGTKVDSNEVQMDDVDQHVTGRTGPPGNHPVRTGAQGEKYVREFSKMTLVKKAIRDNKDEKGFRKNNVNCHYDALCETFVGKRYSNEGMLPKLKPTEVVGIIMVHKTYQDPFEDAVSVDLESYCS